MKKLLLIIFLAHFISCNTSEDFGTSIDLGKNYRFVDDTPYTIIYNTDDECQDCGIIIVPSIITNYKHNYRYIIAKTKSFPGQNKPIEYWIIDKEMKGAEVFPMDSASFYNKLNEQNINLEFSKENEKVHPRIK